MSQGKDIITQESNLANNERFKKNTRILF
jgi:hypothetical protein